MEVFKSKTREFLTQFNTFCSSIAQKDVMSISMGLDGVCMLGTMETLESLE